MTDILVQNSVKLWPREVFYITDPQCVAALKESLDCAGVYILYLDFDAFYVGQSLSLFTRLQGHARKRYQLWNHFSAFVVPRKEQLDYVEAMMIAATPRTANSKAASKSPKLPCPTDCRRR